MINPEDMLKLAYKASVLRVEDGAAIILTQKNYVDFINHYGHYLKLMMICQQDQEFNDALQKMIIVHNLKSKA